MIPIKVFHRNESVNEISTKKINKPETYIFLSFGDEFFKMYQPENKRKNSS
jgi:hypothetical protein